MLHYIIQILAFQLLFLVVYDLFLKKETFFDWNRVYLLITPILSFILPLIKIKAIQENIPQEYIIQLPAVLIKNTTSQHILLPEVILNSSESLYRFLILSKTPEYVWCIGMVMSSLLFLYKIYKILIIKRSGTKTKLDHFNLISVPNTNIAFSFFNTIFLGTTLSEAKKTNILLHEKIHVREYHSLDLIFFEILRVIFWFNPLVYVYQNRVSMLQEYIADAKAITETSKKEYYQDLLSQIFQTDKISFINTFFNHSLIKKRIIMLQKSKSKKIFQLKYLLLIPVVCTMLIYTSCTQETITQDNSESKDTAAIQKTPLLAKIEALKHQIEIQGNVTPEEEKALNALLKKIAKGNKSSIGEGVPFTYLDKVPGFPGCEDLTKGEAKKCFVQNIKKYVAQEYNVELGKGLQGIQKIKVKFRIDKTGKVTDIKAGGSTIELRTEALRVLESLPQMTPGIKDGKPVSVLYSLPIAFEYKE